MVFFRIVLLALVLTHAVSAQTRDFSTYAFRTWSTEHGLPQITVHSMQRDAQGALWVGTENGLVRLHGLHMDVFQTSNTPALRSNWIEEVLPLGGRIYVATQKNLAWWDGVQFHEIPGSERLGSIRELAGGRDGQLWILADHLWSWDGQHLQAVANQEQYFVALGTRDGNPTLADNQGGLWEFHAGVLQRLSLRWSKGSAKINQLRWSDRQWYLGTEQGLFRWTPGAMAAQHQPLPGADGNGAVQALTQDADQRIWTLSNGTLHVLEGDKVIATLPKTGTSALGNPRTLLAENLSSFWVGSLSSGLRHYWHPPTTIVPPGREAPKAELQSWAYASTSQGLLVGTNHGIWRTDGQQAHPFLQLPALANQVVYSLLEDRDKRLWIGTRKGLYVWHAKQLTPVQALSGIQINTLYQRRNGELLAASNQGLFMLDPNHGLAHRLFRESLPGRVSTLHETEDGRLWIGSDHGLWHLDQQTLKAVAREQLGDALITALSGWGTDGLLVGTYQHGVHQLHGKDHLRGWMQADGLPSNGVFSLNTHAGWVWASYADGIFRFQLPNDGTQVLEFQQVHFDQGEVGGRSRVRCCNGLGRDKGHIAPPYLWTSSLAGLVRTELDLDPPSTGPTTVGKVLANGQLLQPQAGEFTLTAQQRDLEIAFEANEYHLPERLQYRYRMPPFQPEWRNTGNRRVAYFTNVPSGDFQFEAEASWNGQRWGNAGRVGIRIAPAWTEHTAIRLGMLLALGAGLYMLVQLRSKQLRLRSEQLHLEVERKTADLQSANAQLASLNAMLEHTSVTDALTGLPNRRFAMQIVPTLLAHLQRQPSTNRTILGVCLIDLDHFKQVNDQCGHDVGDQVLQGAAAALRVAVRDMDYAIRWGGEEFLLLLQAPSENELLLVAERVHLALGTHANTTPAGPITASIGMAALPLPNGDMDQHAFERALLLADHAMYTVKKSGRNATGRVALDATVMWPPDAVRSECLKEWEAHGQLRVELFRSGRPHAAAQRSSAP